MSVYNRKGGSGKSGSLRQQFNYYKRQLRNRLIDEQAFIEARGGFSFSGKPPTLFKNLDYEQIMTKGITRKVGNRTIRYKGEEAVRIQIESLRKRASKSYQAQVFIENYIDTLYIAGLEPDQIDSIEKLLNKLSIDKLSILIDKGVLPSIQYVYAESDDPDKVYDDIIDAIDKGVSKSELDEVQARRKVLRPLIKSKFDIMGW